MAMNRDKRRNESGADDSLKEVVVFVNRCAKTVKGGRRMSFSAVVVVGNPDELAESLRRAEDTLRRILAVQ